jgi:hypothetical protein
MMVRTILRFRAASGPVRRPDGCTSVHPITIEAAP